MTIYLVIYNSIDSQKSIFENPDLSPKQGLFCLRDP